MNETTNAAGPRYLTITEDDERHILPFLLERLKAAGEKGLTVREVEADVAAYLAPKGFAVTTPALTSFFFWLFANGHAKRTTGGFPVRYYAITTEGDVQPSEVAPCQ